MGKTIVVCGFGPGISESVARRFGAEGFQVALVARNADKLARAAAALGEAGITAKGFACDLGDPAAVKAMMAKVRADLGPVTVIHWNAYVGLAGDLTSCDVNEVRAVLDVGVTGLVVAMQSALADMKNQPGAAILVTGGGFALADPNVDAMIVKFNAMGLSLAKTAQHKLVGLLHKKLAGDGIYVGEVMVLGMVKGTAFDHGNATLDPAAIAERFWEIYQSRTETTVRIG